ncbi:iron chelate uptake ABC transporter family permease subunit [Streptomyces sp. CAU 1734]|uniref:iron chelate uptake ABC transporter family permease subunit n=1 Tax=Streptomyces sp. CAU 1734 TaxID=3140360 RepID=UPI003260BF58
MLTFIATEPVLALLATRSLNAIALGDDLARTLDAGISRTQIVVVVVVTLLAGVATGTAGPIGSVDLMVSVSSAGSSNPTSAGSPSTPSSARRAC